jgi:hypothetical protein
MPLSQNRHIPDHYETPGHLSSRTTPSSEPDSRTASGSRKRVPVAVCVECFYNVTLVRLTMHSVKDVESARSNAAAMKETIRVVRTAGTLATGTPVDFYE